MTTQTRGKHIRKRLDRLNDLFRGGDMPLHSSLGSARKAYKALTRTERYELTLSSEERAKAQQARKAQLTGKEEAREAQSVEAVIRRDKRRERNKRMVNE